MSNDLLVQCDLKGADSWTIACQCAALGDPTMLDDLRAGMKVQNIIVLLYTAGSEAERQRINALPRAELKELCKTVNGESWQYAASKKIIYGGSYGSGLDKISEMLLKDSYKETGEPIYVAPALCGEIQRKAVFFRYPGIPRWWKQWEQELLHGKGQLRSSIGHVRTFHGRKADWKGGVRQVNIHTRNEALASEPQLMTTYCIERAQCNCWYDEENRREDGGLHIRPCLTVHDSFISRFPASLDREWVKAKHRQWFDFEVEIAGIRVKIPFSGTLGRSWDMKESEPI